MDLQNLYRSSDKKYLVQGHEIVHVRMSTTGSGPSLLYKIYFYVRNIGWICMAIDADPVVIDNALVNLMGDMISSSQNTKFDFPWTT